jgi:hypothetical protein
MACSHDLNDKRDILFEVNDDLNEERNPFLAHDVVQF